MVSILNIRYQKQSKQIKTLLRAEHIESFLCLYSMSAHQCIHPLLVTPGKFDLLLRSSLALLRAAKFPYQVWSWQQIVTLHESFNSRQGKLASCIKCLEMRNIMVYSMIFHDIPKNEFDNLCYMYIYMCIYIYIYISKYIYIYTYICIYTFISLEKENLYDLVYIYIYVYTL